MVTLAIVYNKQYLTEIRGGDISINQQIILFIRINI